MITPAEMTRILRAVLGGGADISAANPLETHDPTVEDVETKLDNVKTVVDAILVDTGTTLENKLDAIKAVVDAILVDTGTTLEAKLDALALICTAARGLLIDRLSLLAAGGAGQLTPARVLLLDNLDALVSSRAAPGDAMDLLAATIVAIRQSVCAGGDPAGSIGKLLNDYLDATISSRSTLTQAQVLSDATPFAGADVGNILLDTQIRKVQSGIKAINAAATKYLYIDSGTNGAEILSIAIEGVIGHDWTLDVYVPAADAEAATSPQSKRDAITYLAADTEGGLLGPFGIPFDAYLDFTNNGVNDQIDQVTITYRSRAALTLTWEA